MQLSVKSAHTILSGYHSIKIVRNGIMRRSADLTVEPTLAIEAVKPLLMRPNIVDQFALFHTKIKILEQFCQKDQQILKTCLREGLCWKALRRSVSLDVDPTLTVSGLKSMLQSRPWVPKQNLVLVHHNQSPLEDDSSTLYECGVHHNQSPLEDDSVDSEDDSSTLYECGVHHNQSPLEDDSSTLYECGVKDRNTLLVCMGGRFKIAIHEIYRLRDFAIHVSSCFVSIGTVKEEIYRKTGHLPEDQELYYNKTSLDNNNDTPLVAFGIVPPYLREISPYLTLAVPKDMKIGELYL